MEPTNAPHPDSIRRYLLGMSDPAEGEQIERRLLADPAFYDEISACEDELLDEYIGGGLAARERENFESIFLAAPARRQKLRFALALRRRSDAALPPLPAAAFATTPAGRAVRAPRAGFFGRVSRPARLGFASAVLVASAGAFLLAVRDPRPTPAPPAAGDRAENLSRSSESPPAPVATVQPDDRAKTRAKTVAFKLTPGLSRGGNDDPARRGVIPAGTEYVRLELRIAAVEYPGYSASVQNLDGSRGASLTGLATDSAGGEPVVVAVLPASMLPPGDYRIKLSGQRDDGDPEPVASYFLGILRQ